MASYDVGVACVFRSRTTMAPMNVIQSSVPFLSKVPASDLKAEESRTDNILCELQSARPVSLFNDALADSTCAAAYMLEPYCGAYGQRRYWTCTLARYQGR
jgi:hypothetical protein